MLCRRTWSTINARLDQLLGERRVLEEVAQQSSGAVTFVRLRPLSAVAAAVSILASASFFPRVLAGAKAFIMPLDFLMSHPDLDRIDAAA